MVDRNESRRKVLRTFSGLALGTIPLVGKSMGNEISSEKDLVGFDPSDLEEIKEFAEFLELAEQPERESKLSSLDDKQVEAFWDANRPMTVNRKSTLVRNSEDASNKNHNQVVRRNERSWIINRQIANKWDWEFTDREIRRKNEGPITEDNLNADIVAQDNSDSGSASYSDIIDFSTWAGQNLYTWEATLSWNYSYTYVDPPGYYSERDVSNVGISQRVIQTSWFTNYEGEISSSSEEHSTWCEGQKQVQFRAERSGLPDSTYYPALTMEGSYTGTGTTVSSREQ